MSVSIVDGKVVEAPLKVRRKIVVRYGHIVFERPDGGTERIGKVVAAGRMADAIVPGAEGRFYFYEVLGGKGIHGVRLADGTERHAYPTNNLWVFGILAAVSFAWIAFLLLVEGDFPLAVLLALGIGALGFALVQSNRAAARRQFDSDAHGRPGAAASTAN
jgi:hypothetical protein